MIIISSIIIFIILLSLIKIVYNISHKEIYLDDKLSFKETLNLCGLPIVTFNNNGVKIHCLLDTGATASIINKDILDKIEYQIIDGKTNKVIGIGGEPIKTHFIRTVIQYKNNPYLCEFQVLDNNKTFNHLKKATKIDINGIIGTNFFEYYKYVIDFKDMIAYSKYKR